MGGLGNQLFQYAAARTWADERGLNLVLDMTMCDVTEIPCQEGDEVIIFGDNPSVDELAAKIGTISYEILTNVSERVNRIYYQE